jgi:8-oxo-dGTP diphosphatase
MQVEWNFKNIVKNGEKLFMPSLSVDCVIFGFHGSELKVLLLKMKHVVLHGLPGGFILKDEPADAAATRILKERTGLDNIFLQQFYTFGEPRRSDKKIHVAGMKKEALPVDKNNWLLQRFVSIGYYALVEFSQVTPTPDELSSNCDWYDLQTIPPLMMDHTHILNKALETLQQHINRQPIGYNLLPLKFTMPELQKLYEAILGKQLDRRNFQRKILSYGILKKLKEVKTGVAHKAPFLYSFDLKKYNEALKNGLGGGW